MRDESLNDCNAGHCSKYSPKFMKFIDQTESLSFCLQDSVVKMQKVCEGGFHIILSSFMNKKLAIYQAMVDPICVFTQGNLSKKYFT